MKVNRFHPEMLPRCAKCGARVRRGEFVGGIGQGRGTQFTFWCHHRRDVLYTAPGWETSETIRELPPGSFPLPLPEGLVFRHEAQNVSVKESVGHTYYGPYKIRTPAYREFKNVLGRELAQRLCDWMDAQPEPAVLAAAACTAIELAGDREKLRLLQLFPEFARAYLMSVSFG